MAPRRQPTGRLRGEQLDALDRRIDWTDVTARATAGLTRWVLGTGLLSLHALVFLVAGLGMLFANILTDPSDITAGEPLLRWGIVLGLHAAAVLIGWTIWRVVHPPAERSAYRPLPRAALGVGRPAPLTAEPVWYPDGSANGHVSGSGNGHAPHPAGAWQAWEQPRTVVTSRRVTTTVVATARDGLAAARRRYRRDQRPPVPNGVYPAPAGGPPGQAWAQPGTAPGSVPNGSPPTAYVPHPADAPHGQPTTSWSAAITRDEVISVTQIEPRPDPHAPRAGDEDHVSDPVRSWLDSYLDGQGREREARWTWVEAAASTWLARGEETHSALPAPTEPGAPGADRPIDMIPADPLTPAAPRPGHPANGEGSGAEGDPIVDVPVRPSVGGHAGAAHPTVNGPGTTAG